MKFSIHFILGVLTSMFMNQLNAQNKSLIINYPETKKGMISDEYFGQQIPDPYRWLEDDRSTATEKWVQSQNSVTYNYLDQIAYRDQN